MSSIVFVHGTGVRAASYRQSFESIIAGLSELRPRPPIVQCLWGAACGAQLLNGGASIPDFDSTNPPSKKEEQDVVSWTVLYEDPLYELRLLGLCPPPPGANLPVARADEECRRLLQTISSDNEILAQLRKCKLSDVWETALDGLLKSSEFTAALNFSGNRMTTEHRETVARALVAQSLVLRRDDEGLIAVNGQERDALVEMALVKLGGRTRSWLGDKLKKTALWVPTLYGTWRRGKLSEQSFPAAADILLYQSRGQAIRDFIRQTIARAIETHGQPVTLLAHSLGGIACVDLLLEENPPPVELLITVGSQAPLLYEANALVSREYTAEPLPQSFPRRWLNIYDPRDFLSYVARGVFHGPEIKDVRVNNGQPFPHSHISYWDNREVFDAISKELP